MKTYGKGAHVLFLVFLVFLKCGVAQDTIVPAIRKFGDSAVDVGNNDFVNHQPTGRFCKRQLATDITAGTLGFKSYGPAIHLILLFPLLGIYGTLV